MEQKLYSNDEIQEMLNRVKKEPFKTAFCEALKETVSYSDELCIRDVLRFGGYVEDFDRYDSAICEYFINAYLKMIEKGIPRKKLFIDMDGTLNVFKEINTLETLYEKGYFLNLVPHENVVRAVKNIIDDTKNEQELDDPGIEVFVLSSYLSDSKYALKEKNEWLDKYLPEIGAEHRLFVPCGEDKRVFIEKKYGYILNPNQDYLLDDYSTNIHSWQPPGIGIKLMNGINGNFGTWQGNKLTIDRSAEDLVMCIKDIIYNNARYNDIGPNLLDMQNVVKPHKHIK